MLLGAYSGLIVCFIELIKCILYYKTDKDNLIFWISVPIYLIIMAFSSDSFIALLPFIGSLIDGFSLTKNKNIATFGSVISNILWVIYDIVILAYSCAITDGILVISNISILVHGYSTLLRASDLRIVVSRSLSRKNYNQIFKLDKKNYGDEFTWSYEYEKSVYEKNEKSLLLIKYHNDTVGYLKYLIVNEEEYLKIINSDKVIKYYDLNNIRDYKKNQKNYLIIDSINVSHKFQNSLSADLVVKKIRKIVCDAYKNQNKIEKIVSIVLNKFEEEILNRLDFNECKKYLDKGKLFVLDNKNIEEIYLKNNRKRDYYKYKVYENDKVTDEMIKNIGSLDSKFFKEEYLWDQDYQLKLFNKNKNSMIVVTYNNKLIGYLNYLVITKEKYDEMLKSNISVDNFEFDEVTKFYKNRKNYLTLNSIVIDKNHQDGYAIKLLTNKFKKIIKRMNDDNYKIYGIVAVAISKDGQKFLNRLNFKKVRKLEDNNYLYVLENYQEN